MTAASASICAACRRDVAVPTSSPRGRHSITQRRQRRIEQLDHELVRHGVGLAVHDVPAGEQGRRGGGIGRRREHRVREGAGRVHAQPAPADLPADEQRDARLRAAAGRRGVRPSTAADADAVGGARRSRRTAPRTASRAAPAGRARPSRSAPRRRAAVRSGTGAAGAARTRCGDTTARTRPHRDRARAPTRAAGATQLEAAAAAAAMGEDTLDTAPRRASVCRGRRSANVPGGLVRAESQADVDVSRRR